MNTTRRQFGIMATASAAGLMLPTFGRAQVRDPQPLDEFYNHDAMGLAELVSKGEVTAEELLEVVIKRIETVNPKLNAIEQINIELAREKARQGLPEGPFQGVPSFIQANIDFPGFSTTYCCKGFADAPPVT